MLISTRSRTTRITLDGLLRGKIIIMLKIFKTLLIRISQYVYAKKKVLKFALVVELAKLNFTYITVLK